MRGAVGKPGAKTGDAMRCMILAVLKESARIKMALSQHEVGTIQSIAKAIIACYRAGGKVLIFGNGGSAADAQHLAAELVGRFKLERKALPALALTTNTSIVTAVANDYGYDEVFSRQVEALAAENDVVIGISTSGNSPNVIEAIKVAKKKGARAIGLTGGDGGRLAGVAELVVVVPSHDIPRIQEAHITIGHIVCELVEKGLFGSSV